MSGYEEFTDVTGDSAGRDPLVRGGLVAYYVTGSGGVPETPAQIAAAETAGMGVVRIDQTPGGQLFAAGKAQVYDVEYQAGTPAAAAAACRARVALAIRQHTLYVSLSALPALRSAVAGIPGVVYGVADYSWSLADAEAYLAATPDAVYAQFGDPQSNPSTDVPGTSVTLTQANADIDVAKASWAAQFMPGAPAPPEGDTYVLPQITAGATGNPVKCAQMLLGGLTVDGVFGPLTAARARTFQAEHGLAADGICGPLTWSALMR